jgi:hypothetical protein
MGFDDAWNSICVEIKKKISDDGGLGLLDTRSEKKQNKKGGAQFNFF